jgi:serine protease Do
MRLKLAIGMALLAAGTVGGAFAQTTPPRARAAASVGNSTYLGIGVQDIDADRAKALNLKEVRGVEVTSVAENSPASKAGLKDGDVVLEYNGQAVEGGEQLSRLVRETPVGRQVKIGVWRNGSMQTLTATTEARRNVIISNGDNWMVMPSTPPMPPMPNMPSIEIPRFNMTWQSGMLGIIGESMSQQEQLADFFGVKDGVLVKSVNKNSSAEKAGIKAGDVIVKVEDEHVSTTRDITSALRSAHGKKTVNVTVVRNKKEMVLPVTIEASVPSSAVRAELVLPGTLVIGPLNVEPLRIGPISVGRLHLDRLVIPLRGRVSIGVI